MIDGIPSSAATATQDPHADSSSSLSRLAGDYNSFLQLLTAQVSNQDPLEPMDSSTFVTQLAQLSQVEQSVKVNSNLETISSQIASANAMTELQLIGHTVTVTGDAFQAGEEPVTLGYTLAEEAVNVTAHIRSSDGSVVQTFNDLPTTPGTRHDILWDGLNSQGEPIPSNGFTIEILATDESGEPVSYAGYVPAKVESVILGGDAPEIVLDNGEGVVMSRILEVA